MKKFTPFLFSSTLILPSFSYAIGLSGIQVTSHLNQPLSAQIQLMAIDGISLNELTVGLASASEYDAVGMERSYELAKVRFNISKNKQGKTVIDIRSDGPIDEPYLQFLLDIRWPNGKMVRGYTVLLDPPNYKVVAKPALTTKPVKKSQVVKSKPIQQGVIEQDDDIDLTTESEAKIPSPVTVTKADDSIPSKVFATPGQAIANTPELSSNEAPMPAQAEAKPKESTVVSKQAEPVDSIPTVLQAPEIATMSQPTPMKGVTKETTEIENIDETPVAEFGAKEREGDAAATPTTAPVTTTTSTAKSSSNAANAPANNASGNTANKSAAQTPEKKSVKVGEHDSLWNIAKKIPVDAPINLNQVMMALKKANPDAFINNNVNGLKKGAVLNVPNYNMMKSVQTVDAEKALYAQNQQWKQPNQETSESSEKPEHPLRNMPAKEVTIAAKPQLNFRVTDIEQTPSLRPGENPGKAPQAINNPTVSVSASAASQAQQSDAFLKNSMADYVKANEVLKKRLSTSEQENSQLRAELIKLTETIQEQGIKRQSVKMDVQEGPSLPSQVHDVDIDSPQDNTMRLVMWILLALTSGAAGLWWWQRRTANAFAQDRVMATPMAKDTAVPVYGATPAAQSLRFSQMEQTVIEPIADEGKAEVSEARAANTLDYSVDGTGATPIEGDPYATKLDLAQAYIAMEDLESAIPLLREVMESGDEQQRQEAHHLLTKIT